MPRERSTAVFELMGNVNEPARDGAPHAVLPTIVAWEHKLEDAVLFLAESLSKGIKKGKKPVVMHSIRVGSTLIARGCTADVVLAGMLHDIMEKAPVTSREISRRFGVAVALMVGATTNNLEIVNPLERYEDSLIRCAALGEGALMVRVADLLDNCDRLTALGQYDRLDRLGTKLRMLIAYAKAYHLDSRVIADLSLRVRRIHRLTGTQSPLPLRLEPPTLVKQSVPPKKAKRKTATMRGKPSKLMKKTEGKPGKKSRKLGGKKR